MGYITDVEFAVKFLDTSVLRAGHLVASSGDERDSLLLLDWRGCPPDPSTFPALVSRDPHTLSALFKAFRFPSSPILKFSLILTICEGICQPVSKPVLNNYNDVLPKGKL